MSSSVPMPLASELRQAFSFGGHRAIKVEIEDETLKLGTTLPKGGSEAADFDKLKGMVTADAPCYILFHISSPPGWLVITYVPETVKVSDKMVYAATKSRLKTELGNEKFVDEFHANEPGDLVWSNYSGDKSAPLPYSAREKAVHALDKMEADARKEFGSSQINTHSGNKSSGYHTVTLPFTESTNDALQQLKEGVVNFVELKVSESKDSIEAVGTQTIEVSELAAALPAAEPRFCFYYWANAPSGSSIGSSVPRSAGTSTTHTPIANASVSSLTSKFETAGGATGTAYNQTGGYRAAGGFVTPGGLRTSGATATSASAAPSGPSPAINNSKIFFIYYCPDKSPPQLRMVYSTAKPAVAASAEPIVGQVRRKVEVSDQTELTEEFLRSSAAAPSSPYNSPFNSPLQARLRASGGSQLNSSSKQKAIQGHPVYTMGSPTVNSGGKSKRIVIPPPVAY